MEKREENRRKFIRFSAIYAVAALIIAGGVALFGIKTAPDDPAVYIGECDYGIDYAESGYETPDIDLNRGIYSLTIAYETNGFVAVRPYMEQKVNTTEEIILTPYTNYAESYIYSDTGTGRIGIGMETLYEGMSFRLLSVRIERLDKMSAAYDAIRILFILMIIWAGAVLVRFLAGDAPSEKKRTVLGLLTIMVISSIGFIPGVFGGYIAGGHDVEAHMGRIAAIADGLGHHILPVRMYRFYANDHGYPMGIFYGDILLYPEAILHLLGVPLWGCYVIYAVAVNILTVLVSYGCFKKISGEYRVGLLSCAVYSLSVWRLTDIYVRAAAGEYAAMAFLPLAALGLYIITSHDDLKKADVKRAVICLAAGFTGIMYTHMLTLVMTLVFTAIYCLIYMKRIISKRRILPLLAAAGITLLAGLGFIIPFIDSYTRSDYVVKHLSDDIGVHGAYLRQLITLTGDYTEVSYPSGEALDMVGEMPISAGPILIFISLALILAIVTSSKRLEGLTIFGIMLMSVWLSTIYFPYGFLGKNFKPGAAIFCKVQFPWRYLVIVTLAMTLAVIYVCRQIFTGKIQDIAAGKGSYTGIDYKDRLKGMLMICILVVTVVEAAVFTYRQISADNKHVDAKNVYGVRTVLIDSDIMYLDQDMDPEILKDRSLLSSSEELMVQDMGYDGRKYMLRVTNSSQEEQWAELPLLDYNGYSASGGLSVASSDDHRIRLNVPAGYSDIVTVSYSEPFYWRIAELITCVTAIIILVYIVKTGIFKHEQDKSGYGS